MGSIKTSQDTPWGGGRGGRGKPSSFSITYSGEAISLNKFYSQRHWSYRKKQKDKYKEIYTQILKQVPNLPKKLIDFSIEMRYNCRFDVDNTIIMVKVFVDTLRDLEIIENDSPKYWKSLNIFYDKSLPKNTFVKKVDWES